jgi:hypothetical protein
MVFVANNQASEVLKPGETPFDLPSALVATKLPTVLGTLSAPAFAVRGNQLNATIILQPLIKAIAVISLIANKTIRRILRKAAVNRRLN